MVALSRFQAYYGLDRLPTSIIPSGSLDAATLREVDLLI